MKNITEINIMSGSYLARKIPFKFVQIRVKFISNSFRIPNSFRFKRMEKFMNLERLICKDKSSQNSL